MALAQYIVAAIVLSAGLFLSGCAIGTAHQNFKETMASDVNRDARGQYAYRNRNRDLLVGTKQLSNGNVEEEFKSGRRLRCRVFFEIDQSVHRIVSWRYEGTEEDCAIVP